MATYFPSHKLYKWSKNKLISNILLWTPKHEHSSVRQPAKTYIHQLTEDIRCCVEDFLIGMDGKREARKSMLSAQISLLLSLWPIDGILTGMMTPHQRGSESDGNECDDSTLPRAPKQKSYNQIQFNVIPRTFFLGGWGLNPQQCILDSANRKWGGVVLSWPIS